MRTFWFLKVIEVLSQAVTNFWVFEISNCRAGSLRVIIGILMIVLLKPQDIFTVNTM
jgi:hypothetical protein